MKSSPSLTGLIEHLLGEEGEAASPTPKPKRAKPHRPWNEFERAVQPCDFEICLKDGADSRARGQVHGDDLHDDQGPEAPTPSRSWTSSCSRSRGPRGARCWGTATTCCRIMRRRRHVRAVGDVLRRGGGVQGVLRAVAVQGRDVRRGDSGGAARRGGAVQPAHDDASGGDQVRAGRPGRVQGAVRQVPDGRPRGCRRPGLHPVQGEQVRGSEDKVHRSHEHARLPAGRTIALPCQLKEYGPALKHIAEIIERGVREHLSCLSARRPTASTCGQWATLKSSRDGARGGFQPQGCHRVQHE